MQERLPGQNLSHESILIPIQFGELELPEVSDLASDITKRKMIESSRLVSRLSELGVNSGLSSTQDPEAATFNFIMQAMQAEYSLQNPDMNDLEIMTSFDYESVYKRFTRLLADDPDDEFEQEMIGVFAEKFGESTKLGIQAATQNVLDSGIAQSEPKNSIVEAVKVAQGIADDHNVPLNDVFVKDDLYLELLRIQAKSPERSLEGLKKMVSLFKGNIFNSMLQTMFSEMFGNLLEGDEQERAEIDREFAELRVEMDEQIAKIVRPIAIASIESFRRTWGNELASEIDLEELLSTDPDYILDKN